MAAEESSFQIGGDEDYVEHRRQKAILDAKAMARDVILDAKRQYSRGQISDDAVQTDARAAVELFITEIEQIAQKVGATDILSETEIHTVAVFPPDELLEYVESEEDRVLGDPPEAKEVATIHGLWGFLTAPEIFTAKWTMQVDTRHSGPEEITASATTRMPVEASIDAYRYVNNFLERVGLDLELHLDDYTGDGGPGL